MTAANGAGEVARAVGAAARGPWYTPLLTKVMGRPPVDPNRLCPSGSPRTPSQQSAVTREYDGDEPSKPMAHESCGLMKCIGGSRENDDAAAAVDIACA